MKTIKILIGILAGLGLASCGGHKPPNTQPTAVQIQVGTPVTK